MTKEQFINRLFGNNKAVSIWAFNDLCRVVFPSYNKTTILNRLISLNLIKKDSSGCILFKV